MSSFDSPYDDLLRKQKEIEEAKAQATPEPSKEVEDIKTTTTDSGQMVFTFTHLGVLYGYDKTTGKWIKL